MAITQKECEALGGTWTKEGTCVFIHKLPKLTLHQGPCGGFLEMDLRFRKAPEPRPLALVKPLERAAGILKTLTATAQRQLALQKTAGAKGAAGAMKTAGAKGAAGAMTKRPTKPSYRSTIRKK